MKVLVDTNVWLDIALQRQPFYAASNTAVAACINDQITVLAAATSLKDVFYLVSRALDPERGYRAVGLILEIADVAPVDEPVCKQALQLERPDYEDGMIAAIAQLEQVDCILTRDNKAFRESSVEKQTPTEFLSTQGYEEIPF